MALSATYAFYRDEYGGELGAEAFAECLSPAERHVRWMCGYAEVLEESASADAYLRAICAAVDAFAEWGEGQTGGFEIGSFHVTHYDNRGTTGSEQATLAAMKELGGTGLLFGGCGR